MGVPKFFRWISERYPCLSELIKEYKVPEFDNLYLDMNGIIHTCSHPNDDDPHFRITEENIFAGIFNYIEVLFRLIQPKKLFFMAVDGVAPRAKMNQQRGRRFRSAKEAEVLEQKALERGEVLPKESRFDSNCITPGTAFMARLQEQLKYFIVKKISSDPLWRKPTIILSGHNVPGEGEHKIMDYIRFLRSKDDWDPNTRHCLYGLDADLITLGICTHEPNFSILREEVTFGKPSKQGKRLATAEETNFYLLHLSLLRDYLDLEFQALKTNLPFKYDLECIVDDWVLMTFLVGNDFIPNLPHLHINEGALPILYSTYIKVLPTLGGYINENGFLNLERFECYMNQLADFDFEQFKETHADMTYFLSKTGRDVREFMNMPPEDSKKSDDLMDFSETETDGNKTKKTDLEMLISLTNEEIGGDDDDDDSEFIDVSDSDDDGETALRQNFSEFKEHYYKSKLEYQHVDNQMLDGQAEGYVRAIQWILRYYYTGCPSWSWYYPHHYSPYISDIKNFKDVKLDFDIGKPFLPFQQLMAVLPSASKQFLPTPMQQLMTSETSPIFSYYPKDFEIDLNGKKQDWEGVVLIPFINEEKLLKAMEPYYDQMTDEEKHRNSTGSVYVYNYSGKSNGTYQAPQYFTEVRHNHTTVKELKLEDIIVPREKLRLGKLPKVSDAYQPGFPTLGRISFKANLEAKKVKVFNQPSRNESMILKITRTVSTSAKEAASELLRGTVFVEWPHLTQAKVVKVADKTTVYELLNNEITATEAGTYDFACHVNEIMEKLLTRFGILINEINILVFVYPVVGCTVEFDAHGKAGHRLMWSNELSVYPLQMCLRDVPLLHLQRLEGTHIKDFYSKNKIVFMIGVPHYGYQGKVLEIDTSKPPKLRVELVVMFEPDLSEIESVITRIRRSYLPSNQAANRLGISSHLLSRLTGSIFVSSPHTERDKVNIGLNLKFNKVNKEIVGYTRKDGNTWLYSPRAVKMVTVYMQLFPDIIEYLEKNAGNDIFFKDEMFKDKDGEDILNTLKKWLKDHEVKLAEKRSVGSASLDPEAIEALEKLLMTKTGTKEGKKVTMKVKPHLAFLPKAEVGMVAPDPSAKHEVLDRVMFVRKSHAIPLGTKGTIVGIEKEDNSDDLSTLYDVLFDDAFPGGIKLLGCKESRCYRITKQTFINISYGKRLEKSSFKEEFSTKQAVNYSKQVQPTKKSEMDRNSAFASVSSNSNNVAAFFNKAAANSSMKPNPTIINRPTADSEFQAMWNNLQQQVRVGATAPNVRKPAQLPVYPNVANQQTESLRKILGLNDTRQTDSQNNYARVSNRPDPHIMNDRGNHMANHTLGLPLPPQPPIPVTPLMSRPFHPPPQGVLVPNAAHLPQFAPPIFNHPPRQPQIGMTNLPPPPQQWFCPNGVSVPPRKDSDIDHLSRNMSSLAMQDTKMQSNVQNSVSNVRSAPLQNPFVPLQVQKGLRIGNGGNRRPVKPDAGSQDNKVTQGPKNGSPLSQRELVHSTPKPRPASSQQRPRLKIAAKFSTPIDK